MKARLVRLWGWSIQHWDDIGMVLMIVAVLACVSGLWWLAWQSAQIDAVDA